MKEIDGEPRMFSVAVDITDRKVAVKALRESEERLRIAIESGPMYAFEWNAITDETRRSAKGAEILDLADDRPLEKGHAFIDRIHPEDRQKYLDHISALSPGNPRYKAIFRLLRHDQTVLWLEEAGRAFFGPDDKIRKIVGMTVDVTETRESEHALGN